MDTTISMCHEQPVTSLDILALALIHLYSIPR